MFQGKKIPYLRLGFVLALATAVACGDDIAVAPSEARISTSDDISTRAAAPMLYASVNGVLVAISPDTVESLEIEFTEVSYLPAEASDEDEETDGGWQSLVLDVPVILDLMALPTEAEGSIEIASGEVPVGSYRKVRLITGEGEIVFKGPIDFGGGGTLDGGIPHPVNIPSGDQTGLKTDVSFEVTEGEDGTANAANIVFEAGTTFQNITVTGNGTVTINPVLRSK